MPKVTQTGESLLDKIVDIIIPPEVVAFLNQTLYRNQWIIFNYWTFVHFFAGVFFYLLISKNFKLWIIINIVFEIIEYILGLSGNPLFTEEILDIIWDIAWSLVGFKIIQLILWFKNKN